MKPKPAAEASMTSAAGGSASSPGRRMTRMPANPASRASSRRGQALAEEQHGQDRAPDGRGELDGEDLGQRQQRQAVDPAGLGGEVHAVADRVPAPLGRAQQARAEAGDDEAEHEHAEEAAEEEDLEGSCAPRARGR
jgi:hypothetical protein